MADQVEQVEQNEEVEDSSSLSEPEADLDIVCYACTVLLVPCDPVCVLTPLFTRADARRLDELHGYFDNDVAMLKARLKAIPPQLRLKWVKLGPLPKPVPFPAKDVSENVLQMLPTGLPCFPCWSVEPNVHKICSGCPLSPYFTKENVDSLEILRLSCGGNMKLLGEKISSFEAESVSVEKQISDMVAAIWEDAIHFLPDFKRHARAERGNVGDVRLINNIIRNANRISAHVIVQEVGAGQQEVGTGQQQEVGAGQQDDDFTDGGVERLMEEARRALDAALARFRQRVNDAA